MGTLSWPEILIIAAIVIVPYFLPTVIAFWRRHLHRGPIAAINILLGWTVLGWIAALAWAVAGDTAPSPGSSRGFE